MILAQFPPPANRFLRWAAWLLGWLVGWFCLHPGKRKQGAEGPSFSPRETGSILAGTRILFFVFRKRWEGGALSLLGDLIKNKK
ncbi:hypothetical protein I7I50_12487 [Histoplasma capsulatum G186AR]|uniref:Uncharacterized protein n=1 Tax=Ajellomyces capsulatus TaxID=5037 RepID=A0A8H8CRS2_AJECA|nr:hypothetical protein I7I52_11206 [Histoplasma capsulatum]QSS70753.1 hypothetical protein I7I50_12487 [Histoplasma capsulatum G186AR]